MYGPFIPGGAQIAGFFGLVIWGFFSLLALAVAIGLIFLLVRFLLIATRAAQLYVAKNEPVRTVPPTPAATPSAASPTATAAPTAAPASTAPASTAQTATTAPVTKPISTKPISTKPTSTKPAATTKPASKPRTPKS